jgi:UDP-glucose 4-epimerase
MKAVVVGGRGFLGSAVVTELLSRGDSVSIVEPFAAQAECDTRFGDGRVRAIQGNMLRPDTLVAAFQGADEVYHMGGKLGTSELEDSVHEAVAANITGALHVFDSAIAAGVPTVFYPTKPNVWLNTYTVTKVAAEQFALLYCEHTPLRIRSLRYFNAYGPWQALGPVKKIVPIFAARALNRQPLIIYGDGEQTVDMIYSEDIGRITVDFTRSSHQGVAVNCGRGVAMSVNEVAALVNEMTGNNAGVRHVPMRRGETEGTRLVADITPLQRVLSDVCFSNLESTLADTIDWYQSLGSGRLTAAIAS